MRSLYSSYNKNNTEYEALANVLKLYRYLSNSNYGEFVSNLLDVFGGFFSVLVFVMVGVDENHPADARSVLSLVDGLLADWLPR